MSAKKFFKKLLRYTLCLAAGLAAFAACGYTDYRLWPLDLPASAHPRVPMTAVANQQLVLPFTPGVPVAGVERPSAVPWARPRRPPAGLNAIPHNTSVPTPHAPARTQQPVEPGRVS